MPSSRNCIVATVLLGLATQASLSAQPPIVSPRYDTLAVPPSSTGRPAIRRRKNGHVMGSGVWRFKDVKFVHLRGGSFLSRRMYCSSGAVNGITVGTDINAGFRIVRTLSRKTSDGK